jgi:hypothetical protein
MRRQSHGRRRGIRRQRLRGKWRRGRGIGGQRRCGRQRRRRRRLGRRGGQRRRSRRIGRCGRQRWCGRRIGRRGRKRWCGRRLRRFRRLDGLPRPDLSPPRRLPMLDDARRRGLHVQRPGFHVLERQPVHRRRSERPLHPEQWRRSVLFLHLRQVSPRHRLQDGRPLRVPRERVLRRRGKHLHAGQLPRRLRLRHGRLLLAVARDERLRRRDRLLLPHGKGHLYGRQRLWRIVDRHLRVVGQARSMDVSDVPALRVARADGGVRPRPVSQPVGGFRSRRARAWSRRPSPRSAGASAPTRRRCSRRPPSAPR